LTYRDRRFTSDWTGDEVGSRFCSLAWALTCAAGDDSQGINHGAEDGAGHGGGADLCHGDVVEGASAVGVVVG
jgi:hypothetical protein